MSRRKSPILINNNFISRFTEICGTSQPAEIQRALDISYGAAKNYLQGKLPETNILLAIAEKTNFSIHWLLTGEGAKTVSLDTKNISLNLAEKKISQELENIIREICLEEISKILPVKNVSDENKKNILETADEYSTTPIILSLDRIKEEKVIEEISEIVSEKTK